MRKLVILVSVFAIMMMAGCAGKRLPPTLLGNGTPTTEPAPETSAGTTTAPATTSPSAASAPALSEAPPPLAGTPAPVATTSNVGVEETPLTTSPAVFTLGNQNNPRTVRIKVSENNGIMSLYTTMIVGDDNKRLVHLKKPAKVLTFNNVRPGTYYLNLENSGKRWAVENEPLSRDQHRALTFNVWVQVNDGDWVQLGSADTELVGNQWWNLKLVIP